MTVHAPRYSMEEFARRGQEIYERDIRPVLKSEDIGSLSRSTSRQANGKWLPTI
jgi:hypothetical protein